MHWNIGSNFWAVVLQPEWFCLRGSWFLGNFEPNEFTGVRTLFGARSSWSYSSPYLSNEIFIWFVNESVTRNYFFILSNQPVDNFFSSSWYFLFCFLPNLYHVFVPALQRVCTMIFFASGPRADEGADAAAERGAGPVLRSSPPWGAGGRDFQPAIGIFVAEGPPLVV